MQTAEITEVVCAIDPEKLLKEGLDHNHITTAEKIYMKELKQCKDGESLLRNLFTASLALKTEFIVAARQYLWLPPLKNPACGDAAGAYTCGCEIQLCFGNASCGAENKCLDLNGNHALICHPGVKAQKATIFEKALEKIFRSAGGAPVRQPATYGLLGGYFSKEDLSSLFCGRLSKQEANERKVLAMKYLDVISENPQGARRIEKLNELREEFPAPMVAGNDENNGIIRFDMKLPSYGPVDCPREIWLDHAIVQETSPTYREQTLEFLQASTENNAAESPAFHKAHGTKTRKYGPLISVASRLAEERKLDFSPTFLFPIVSSFGFMNEDMNQVMKFMVDFYRGQLKRARNRADGLTVAVLKGKFKVQLKNSLCFALLRGNALALYNQGMPSVTHPP